MRLVITGSPGTGKTSVAKTLGKKLRHRVVNEKEFALKKGIGEWNAEENELEIPIKKLEKELNAFLEKNMDIIVEGHLLCETRLKADWVIVLRLHPELLEERLGRKHYSQEKILDNVFCEGIDYCKKHALRKYQKSRVIELHSQKTIKETMLLIITILREKGAKI